jgi:hypothetical protein
MRRVVAALVLLSAVVFAQSLPRPTLSSYTGRWQASFQSQPFFVVVLAQSGDKLTGTIQHTRDIHVNDKGVVDKVAPEMSDEQIVEAKLVGDHLRITGKNSDSQEENVYELQLQPTVHVTTHQTVYNSGLLRFSKAQMPPDVPSIQPWKVTRVGTK